MCVTTDLNKDGRHMSAFCHCAKRIRNIPETSAAASMSDVLENGWMDHCCPVWVTSFGASLLLFIDFSFSQFVNRKDGHSVWSQS